MHRLIGRTMKDNDAAAAIRALVMALPLHWRDRTRAAAHGGKGGSHVGGGPMGEAGMDRRRGIKFRIGSAHDRGHGAPGGETSHIDPPGIDLELHHYSACNPGDDAGLPCAALLVLWLEPVPACGLIGSYRLSRIGGDKAIFFRKPVHPCPNREIVGILRAAMKHDNQRALAARFAVWDIDFIVSRT